MHTAAHAIDLNLETSSNTVAGPDGTSWLKIYLYGLQCIKEVVTLSRDGNPDLTWTCNTERCSNCEGEGCSSYDTLTISIEGAASYSSPPDCKWGDNVMLQGFSGSFLVREISIIGTKGKVTWQEWAELIPSKVSQTKFTELRIGRKGEKWSRSQCSCSIAMMCDTWFLPKIDSIFMSWIQHVILLSI